MMPGGLRVSGIAIKVRLSGVCCTISKGVAIQRNPNAQQQKPDRRQQMPIAACSVCNM